MEPRTNPQPAVGVDSSGPGYGDVGIEVGGPTRRTKETETAEVRAGERSSCITAVAIETGMRMHSARRGW